MHLSLNGVEVHRLAGFMQSRRLNESFKKWTRDSIDSHFSTEELPV